MNFFFEFAFEAGVQNIFVGAGDFEIVDVSTDADGKFSMQTLFGLLAGALEQQVTVFEAHNDVRDDLLETRVFLNDRAAAERVIRKDEIQDGIEMGGREFAGEQRVDAGGWDYEDVFFVHGQNLGTGETFVDDFHAADVSCFFDCRARAGGLSKFVG
jgi:hypothetical protein